MGLELRMLGQLELKRHDQDVRLGGPIERSLLVALALSARAHVRRDALAEALWDGDPPRSADTTLRGYIASLRRALEPDAIRGGYRVLRTAPGGYVLHIDDEQIDARRFTLLLDRARAARSNGELRLAVDRFAEGLGLWRGEALDGLVDASFVRIESGRLHAMRLAGREELLELRVRLGEHERVVDELEAFCTAHPLREHALDAWMLALYRCGRQSDALHAYAAGQRHLRDELGVDPSPPLQRRHRQILGHDDALQTKDRARGSRVRLPRQATSFVGRVEELRAIGQHLRAHRLISVTGIGGAGKTRLALEAAAKNADEFDGDVVFCDLSPVNDPAGVVTEVAAAAGVQRPTVDGSGGDALDNLLETLQPRASLLVLDNCEHLIEACAELIEEVIADCLGVRVLATSRAALRVAGEVEVALQPLAVEGGDGQRGDAVRLFEARAAALAGWTGGEADDVAVRKICRQLDGIPLAIELAAAQVHFLSPTALAERLQDRLWLLAGGRSRVSRHRTLAATLEWSHDLLDPDERVLLRRLGVFPGTFTLDAAEQVCADSLGRRVIALLGSLVRQSLVVVVPAGDDLRYRLLETVRIYALDQLEDAGETEELHARHCQAFLTWVESLPADEQLELSGGRVAEEVHNLRAALAWAESHDQNGVLARLASSMVGYYSLGVELSEATRLFAAAESAELDAAERLRLAAARAWISLLVDSTSSRAAAVRAAELADGLTGTWAALAASLACVNAGSEFRRTGRPQMRAEVARWRDQAFALADDPISRTYALHLVADAHIELEELPEAIALLEEAMALPFESRERAASVVPNLLIAYHLTGRYAQALELSEASRRSDFGIGRARMPRLRAAIALTLAADGRRPEALQVLQEVGADISPLPGVAGQVLVTGAYLALLADDVERASIIFSAALAQDARGLPLGRSGADVALYRHGVRRVRALLDPATARRCRAAGAALSLRDALTLGLSEASRES